MISQIYLSKNSKFIEDDITNRKGSVLIGQSETWDKIYDPNNTFTLGGSKESPVTYTFTETGITEFTINLIGDRTEEGFSCLSSYEIVIQGDKKHVMYSPDECTTLMNTTIPVYGIKGTTTNFLLNLIYVDTFSDRKVGIFFKGSPDTVYSSITAKFISDVSSIKHLPTIKVSQSQKILPNNRYIVSTEENQDLDLFLYGDCKVGDCLEIKNMGKGSIRLMPGEGRNIMLYEKITKDMGGYIKSSRMGDFIRLECFQDNPTVLFSDTMKIGAFSILSNKI